MSMFLEIVMPSTEFSAAGFEGRDEIEDPLTEALSDQSLGDVTGGGAGSGVVLIEVELNDVANGVDRLREILREIGVPQGTTVNRYEPTEETFRVYES